MCFFRVRGGIAVYVFTGYNRFTKKYSSYKDSDVNHYREFKKKNTIIEVCFDF